MFLGAVASGHPATTSAAAEVLRGGGNAFDAAIGAGFAAAVAEPFLTSLAGGGFLLARSVDTRGGPAEETVFDFFVATPGLGGDRRHAASDLVGVPIRFGHAVQDFYVGPASVGTPGVLSGYLAVHERLGRLALTEVVAPAVRIAREGIDVDPFLVQLVDLLMPIIERTDQGRSLFFRDGRPLRVGDRFTNPDLASLLAAVGAGDRTGFDPEELGGNVSAADLSAYRVIERQPLRIDHRGARVLTNPPPSMGGSLVAHGLEVVGHTEPVADRDEPRAIRVRAEALRSVTEHRTKLGPAATRGTTHLAVIDADGNVATMTTSNGSGSGEFAEGLGVQLNNVMGEEDLHPGGFGTAVPGERVGSMMSPTIVELDSGGIAAFGSGGSERIRSTVMGLVLDVVDAGLSMSEAVAAPRLHWDGAAFQVEPGWAETGLRALEDDGWTVNRWPVPDLYFGGAHAVFAHGDPANSAPNGDAVGGCVGGELAVEAVGDPRRGGVGAMIES